MHISLFFILSKYYKMYDNIFYNGGISKNISSFLSFYNLTYFKKKQYNDSQNLYEMFKILVFYCLLCWSFSYFLSENFH